MEDLLNKGAIERLLDSLNDLSARLVDDYDGFTPFEQYEEDRLSVMDACELLEYLLENRKVEL